MILLYKQISLFVYIFCRYFERMKVTFPGGSFSSLFSYFLLISLLYMTNFVLLDPLLAVSACCWTCTGVCVSEAGPVPVCVCCWTRTGVYECVPGTTQVCVCVCYWTHSCVRVCVMLDPLRCVYVLLDPRQHSGHTHRRSLLYTLIQVLCSY